jgi:hypothetical protein
VTIALENRRDALKPNVIRKGAPFQGAWPGLSATKLTWLAAGEYSTPTPQTKGQAQMNDDGRPWDCHLRSWSFICGSRNFQGPAKTLWGCYGLSQSPRRSQRDGAHLAGLGVRLHSCEHLLHWNRLTLSRMNKQGHF